MMIVKYLRIFIVVLVLNFLISFFAAHTYLLYRNTLANNGQWLSMKKEVEMSVLGANNYYNGSIALRKSQLNLGAWQGFQGVTYRHPVNPEEIQFDFLLTNGSYVYFVFNMNKRDFTGIRISAHDAYGDILFHSLTTGEFLKKDVLDISNLKKSSWNRLRISFHENNGSLYMNNILIANFTENILDRQLFGFRGSSKPAFIDNVIVRQKGSDRVIKERFSNTKNRFLIMLLMIFSALAVSGVLFLVLSIFKKDNKSVAFSVILLNILITLFSIASFAAYYYVNELKDRYPKAHGLYRLYRNIMKEEKDFVVREFEIITKRILNNYSLEVPEGVKRILFIGTSQTWGAGARTREETFIRVLENILNNTGTGLYECINSGVQGTRSPELYKYYEKYWIDLNPEITVINLSANDNDTSIFRANLMRFINLNKQKDISTVFVLEANSREVSSDLFSFHDVMRTLGEQHDIPVIDLHDYLLEKDDTGILWWDGVHMTSYAQKLTAEYIADFLLHQHFEVKIR